LTEYSAVASSRALSPCSAGDLFYWPPGHSVRVETDAELVMFSPQADHALVLDHIAAKLAPA
jgi:hypothetical protein